MSKSKYSARLMPFLALPLLAACGGSDSTNPETGPAEDPVTVSGQVMDGYLQNARVFLDLNNNGLRDDAEPETRSGANGEFSLSTTETIPDDATLIAEAIGGVTVDEDQGEPVPLGYTLRSPVVRHQGTVSAQAENEAQNIDSVGRIISPLTTLISQEMIANGRTFAAAADKVTVDLGLAFTAEENYIDLKNSDDPDIALAAERTHRISQVLARVQAKQESQFSGFDFTIDGADRLSFLNTLTANIRAVISTVVADVNLSMASNEPFDPDALAESSSDQLLTTVVAGPDTSTNIYSGEVMYAGFVEGATVFIDRNLNGQRDLNEPFTVTDEDGRFSFTSAEGLVGKELVAKLAPETSSDSTGAPINGEITLYNPIGSYFDFEEFEFDVGLLVNTQLSPAMNLVPRNPDHVASEALFAEAIGTDRQSLLFYARQALNPLQRIADEGLKVSRINAEIGELLARLDNLYGEIDLAANNLTDEQYKLALRSYVDENLPGIVARVEASTVEQVVPGEVLNEMNLDLNIPGLFELVNPEDPNTEDPGTENPTPDDPNSETERPDYTPSLRFFSLSPDFTQMCDVAGERVDIHDAQMNVIETRSTDSSGFVDLSDVPASYYVTVYETPTRNTVAPTTRTTSFEMRLIDAPHKLQMYADNLYEGSLANCEGFPPSDISSGGMAFDVSVSNGGDFDSIAGSASNGYVGYSAQPTNGVRLESNASSSPLDLLLLGNEVADGALNSEPTFYSYQEDVDISGGLVQATINNPVESISKPIEPTLSQITVNWKPLDFDVHTQIFLVTGGNEASTRLSVPTVLQGMGLLQIGRRYSESDYPSSWSNRVNEPLVNDGRGIQASEHAGLRPFSQIDTESDVNAISYTLTGVPFDVFALKLKRTDSVYPTAESSPVEPVERFERTVFTTNVSGTIKFPDIVTDGVYLGTAEDLMVFAAENADSLADPLATQYLITAGGPSLGLDLDFGEIPTYRGYADFNEVNQAFMERRYFESWYTRVHYLDPLVFNGQ